MKLKNAVIILFIILITAGILFANSPNQNPIPELRTGKIYEMHCYKNMICIFCIDGYKWIMTASGIEQAYKIDRNGNAVPARCDE